MIKIYNNDTDAYIGEITESQLQFLKDNLEIESSDDTDYYINVPTIETFEENGAEPGLIDLLKKAIGNNEDVEIRYEAE